MRITLRSRAVSGVLLALILALAVAPASAGPPDPSVAARRDVPEDRYALAGGCYTVLSLPDGRAVAGGPFHFEPTSLGHYLLFTRDERFLGATLARLPALAAELLAGRTAAVGLVDEPGPEATWEVTDGGAPGAFVLGLPATGQFLTADGAGRPRLKSAGTERWTFELADGCAAWPEVELGVSGQPAGGAGPQAEVRGLLDGHMHAMAYEFLGGKAHCGKPWHPYGVEYALVDCPDHLPGGAGAVMENVLAGDLTGTHDTVGWPTFRDWPAPSSLTHEQSYYRWIERAWRGGLRMFVNLLVENTALCQLYPIKRNGCNEMDSARLQARRIRELQDYVDAQSGGPGEGWFRIVTDPFEARRVMNEGKLAVVLGIEVSLLFDCGEYLDVPQCTTDDIDARLDEIYDMGVRQVELVNKFDNALSGVSGDGGYYGTVVNIGNRYATGHWWDMRTCVESHEHPHAYDNRSMNLVDDGTAGVPGMHNADDLVGGVLKVFSSATRGLVAPVYPAGPHCNERGLTELGAYAVRRLIDKGMIFDPDHMSAKGRQQALDILEAARYSGVFSSHSWSSEDAIPRIYALGGVVTPYAGGSAGFVDTWKSWKAMAASVTPPGYLFGFGWGADMNGFGSQGGPRNPAEDNDVDYPFTGPLGDVTIDRQRSGERVYDINVDGVAHYGLYPDWLQDARMLAGARGDELIADMLRGPESYLQMWERADGVAPNDCVTPQDALGYDDLHALLGVRPVALLRQLGQPTTRTGFEFTYCTVDRNGGIEMLTATFDRHQRLASIDQRPARPAEAAAVRELLAAPRLDAGAVAASTPAAGHSHAALVAAGLVAPDAAAHTHSDGAGRMPLVSAAFLVLVAAALLVLRSRTVHHRA